MTSLSFEMSLLALLTKQLLTQAAGVAATLYSCCGGLVGAASLMAL